MRRRILDQRRQLRPMVRDLRQIGLEIGRIGAVEYKEMQPFFMAGDSDAA
jgi:hypothetical protein